MANLRAFNHTVNVVAYCKDNKKYAATIAWGMQVDYDKVVLLMGSQSVTGNNIKKDDIIGVSALNKDQISTANQLGDNHSSEVDKLNGILVNTEGSAITIKDASREMIVKVIDVLHLEKIEEDNLIYGEVISFKENNNSFLNYIEYLDKEWNLED